MLNSFYKPRRSSPLAILLASTLTIGALTSVTSAGERDALFADISRLQAENAELRELRAHQVELLKAMKIDPASALRARRSYASCEASVLARYCPFLRGMFQPQERDE